MNTTDKLAEALRRCEQVIREACEEDPGKWNWAAINADEGAQARDALAAYEQAQAQEPVGEVYCQEHCQFVEAQAAPEAQQAAGQEQDERAAFEAWAVSYSTIPLKRDDDASLGFTGYTEMDQTMLWDAWQARAALAQRMEPLTDEQIAEGRYLTWAAEPEDAPEAWSFFRGARWAERALAVPWGVKLGGAKESSNG